MEINLPCEQLAQRLLGKVLCRRAGEGVLRGVIVETEAYMGSNDKASHSYGGRRTERNEAMYMAAGTCYVYRIYGKYECFNISSAEPGAAVLVRALEPLCGISSMRIRRGGVRDREIANGPSKLCIAMQITRGEIDREQIARSSKIWLEDGCEVAWSEIVATPRIGIRNCGEWMEKRLRFYIRNSDFVSCIRRRRSRGESE